ncbi:MAG TPA: DUF3034 family protein [Alphaproteobacteria bacterium]|nr:DUF3034 family protein [Alphaproteobacteria bacterium]
MTRLFAFLVSPFRSLAIALVCAALFGGARGAAADDLFDSGKLLMTGGVSPIEGAGGGGLVPWALISGYGTRDAIGGNVHYTYVGLNDYDLQTGGVAVGLFDRVELSYARQAFQTGDTGATLGLGRGFTFHQDIIGAKVRLFGDAIFDQDGWLPQVSVGAQYKINDRYATVKSLGAKDDTGVDYYVAASKLFLAQSVLANATLRATRANQYGILGFGGDKNDDYTLQFEGSLAYLLHRQIAVGAEFRSKPDNLAFAKEENAGDIFAAFFVNKNISITAAYVMLGDIATTKEQNGFYFSLQAGF